MSFCSRPNVQSLIRTNKYILIVLICLCCFWLQSCENRPGELKQAEELIQNNPDSALKVLSAINPSQFAHTPSQKALYGLLLCEAWEENDNPPCADSIFNYSLHYYENCDDKDRLARCYFLKAHRLMNAQRFEEGTEFYLKALRVVPSDRYSLLGKIYADMGTIYSAQQDFHESLKKFQLSFHYFKLDQNDFEANMRMVEIGRTYRFMRKYGIAQQFYKKAISLTKDSVVQGLAFQEMGVNYYWAKNFDLAEHYLRKSLKFSYVGNAYAVRCFVLADLFFDTKRYDSAYHYAYKSLDFPANFGTRRECYRILANTAYLKGDLKEMAKLMTCFQSYSDSVRMLEIQSKSIQLENLHNKDQEVVTKSQNIILMNVLLGVVILTIIVSIVWFVRRLKERKLQLDNYKHELYNKQKFLNQNVSQKIIEMREHQAEARKTGSPAEREQLDRELYEKCLHLPNWEAFSCEMNHAFNNIVDTLVQKYPKITQKEIIWCCLHLLNVPNQDRILLLEATTDSLYKLKQRLAQKMNLASTRELDSFLRDLAETSI